MKCKNFKALLQDYIDGTLSYGEKREMDKHIKSCKECAEIYKKELMIDSKFSNIFSEKHLKDDNFTQNVLSQIDKNYYKGNFSHIKFSIKKHAALYALASALIVCILVSIPYIKGPYFKNFIKSYKSQQANVSKPKPEEKDNTKTTDDSSKKNDTNNINNISSEDTAFKILMKDSLESNTRYIYEPLTNKKIAEYVFKTNHIHLPDNYNINEDDILVGNRIYFRNESDDVQYMTLDGKVTTLNFMKPYSSICRNYVVSPDNKKIAWIKNYRDNNLTTYATYTADLDGKNVKELYTINENQIDDLRFIKWSSDNKYIYLSELNNGVRNGRKNNTYNSELLYKFDPSNKQQTMLMKHMLNSKDENNFPGVISTISDDDNLIAYFKDNQIFIQNIKTYKEQGYSIPISDYYIACNAIFSPDGKYVVYTVYLDNNDHTAYAINYVLLNLSTGQSQIIKY